MISQKLQQKQLQKLSPQQIQLMKLLQVPTASLEQRIKEELEANPALEEGMDSPEYDDNVESDMQSEGEGEDRELEFDEYLENYFDDQPGPYSGSGSYNSDEENKQRPIAVQDSFHDFLESQLGLLDIDSTQDYPIALQIIGNLDEDGYLRRNPEAIVDDLLFSQNITTTSDEVRRVLKKIQKLDPPGVGAQDLQESLVLQLERKQTNDEHFTPDQELALTIVRDYFEAFSKKHYDKILKALDVDKEDLRDALNEILKLNPKPASAYSKDRSDLATYVIPDFIITNRDGELDLTLNSRNAPDLRVSNQYRDMLDSYVVSKNNGKVNADQKQAVVFIKQKIDSARWFIDAIVKRQETMFKTMYAIMQFQSDYFLTGDPNTLRPMILKDISDLTGLDISTISRVANSKYVQTEYGTKLLKEFFSESITNSDGEDVSTLEVKNILKETVDAEDKSKPLSDEKLKEIMEEKGYPIARRTIAKYREQLNIPVARLRKKL